MATTGGENSRLLTMPLEILQQIVWHLTTTDYASFRLTCKHLEASVYHGFCKEFFRKKQFMISPFSLQALIDISHSRLATGLNHVIINVERPSRQIGRTGFHHVYNDNPELQRKRNIFREIYIDHLALVDSGYDVEMMAQAFSNLKNLETVELRDFDSDSRYRDGTSWKSYGRITFEQQTDTHVEILGDHIPNFMDDKCDWVARLFQNMLRALGRTSVRPKRFEVNLRYSGLDDKAFKIQKYDEAQIIPVLESLETFFVDLSSSYMVAHVAVQSQTDSSTRCSSYHLRRFFRHIDKVQHLRINFSRFDKAEGHELLNWLSNPMRTPSAHMPSQSLASLPEPPPPVLFANLERLEIGKGTVEPKDLLAFLKKHKTTLRALILYRMDILDNSPSDSKVNQWSKFFGYMARLGLNLNYLRVSLLAQQKPRAYRHHVLLKDCPGAFVWEGKDLDSALKDLASIVLVQWQGSSSHTSDDNSDDDDNDDADLFFFDDDDGEEDDGDDDLIGAQLLALSQGLPIVPGPMP